MNFFLACFLFHQDDDQGKNVIIPPDENLKKYGEMGKPVQLPDTITKEKKKLIDKVCVVMLKHLFLNLNVYHHQVLY